MYRHRRTHVLLFPGREAKGEQADKTAADQFLQAASLKPRRFRARSARRDSEDPERSRDGLSNSQNSSREQPHQWEPLKRQTWAAACGWRQARARKFLSWLALNRELSRATSFDQLSEFLQVRLSEPCNRGLLKGTHQSFIFLEEMVGTQHQSGSQGPHSAK